jgi:hypothetical protein
MNGWRIGRFGIKLDCEEDAMRDRPHDEAMAELFKEDPAYAAELLNSVLEDGDQDELEILLRQMTEADCDVALGLDLNSRTPNRGPQGE